MNQNPKTNEDPKPSDKPRRWTLPTPETLAMIAATGIRDPNESAMIAVDRAYGLWSASCEKLQVAEGTQAYYDQAAKFTEGIPRPATFPATLAEFLALVVNAKTPADSTKRFRDFLRYRALRSCQHDRSVKAARDDKARKAQVEKLMAEYGEREVSQRFAQYKADGIQFETSWDFIAQDYQSWWQGEKSAKARKSARGG